MLDGVRAGDTPNAVEMLALTFGELTYSGGEATPTAFGSLVPARSRSMSRGPRAARIARSSSVTPGARGRDGRPGEPGPPGPQGPPGKDSSAELVQLRATVESLTERLSNVEEYSYKGLKDVFFKVVMHASQPTQASFDALVAAVRTEVDTESALNDLIAAQQNAALKAKVLPDYDDLEAELQAELAHPM
jgi:hypothetical protein